MKYNLIYRLLGYGLAAVLLWFAIVQFKIWVFWQISGYLYLYVPEWWILLAAGMIVMAIILFISVLNPKRYCRASFVVFRFIVALILFCYYWYWGNQDGWIFHDWVAHPFLNECSGAHGEDLFLVTLAVVAYAAVPIVGWLIGRWNEWAQNCPPVRRRRILFSSSIIIVIFVAFAVTVLTVTTFILSRESQKEQRAKIMSTFRARGAIFGHSAPRRVREIPVVGGLLGDILFKYEVYELSGIVAIDDPVNDDDLKVLGGYRNLQNITLSNSKVTDAGIRHLKNVPNLTTINLSGCHITDNCIRDLIHIPKLQALFIDDTDISNQGVARLRLAMPDCSIFYKDKRKKNWR